MSSSSPTKELERETCCSPLNQDESSQILEPKCKTTQDKVRCTITPRYITSELSSCEDVTQKSDLNSSMLPAQTISVPYPHLMKYEGCPEKTTPLSRNDATTTDAANTTENSKQSSPSASTSGASPSKATFPTSKAAEMQFYLDKLKEMVPYAKTETKLSKVQLIHCAIDYITDLQEALEARVKRKLHSQDQPPAKRAPLADLSIPQQSISKNPSIFQESQVTALVRQFPESQLPFSSSEQRPRYTASNFSASDHSPGWDKSVLEDSDSPNTSKLGESASSSSSCMESDSIKASSSTETMLESQKPQISLNISLKDGSSQESRTEMGHEIEH